MTAWKPGLLRLAAAARILVAWLTWGREGCFTRLLLLLRVKPARRGRGRACVTARVCACACVRACVCVLTPPRLLYAPRSLGACQAKAQLAILLQEELIFNIEKVVRASRG